MGRFKKEERPGRGLRIGSWRQQWYATGVTVAFFITTLVPTSWTLPTGQPCQLHASITFHPHNLQGKRSYDSSGEMRLKRRGNLPGFRVSAWQKLRLGLDAGT